MKREGRQHGMVRTYRILPSPINPRPTTRTVNRLDSPPTSGVFTKVPSKPTNHSKFTAKCGRLRCNECHMCPASKAADKAKGAQKRRASDVVINYRLTAWRVVDNRPGLNFSLFSARGILDNLYGGYVEDDDDDHDGYKEHWDAQPMVEEESRGIKIQEMTNHGENHDDDDNDVGIMYDHVEEYEDWCFV